MPSRLTKFARKLRTSETTAEEILWAQLRNRRLDGLKFRRQVPIAGFVVDFCCFDVGLTIELDGRHHAEQKEHDRERRRLIEQHGFLELRFTNSDMKERLDWVMAEIRRAVDIVRANPLPLGEGRSAGPG
jgi:very-short-patch-repair endonuclease